MKFIANAPEGRDALWLATEGRARGLHLHIARDDAAVARLAESLAFFAPGLAVDVFPAWDCLPYDRVSPRRDILAHRADFLSRLDAGLASPEGGRLILTTVNGVLQRVCPPARYGGRRLSLQAGARLDPEVLIRQLSDFGYTRVETVSEEGEFAPRGGLLDVFPPASAEPLRLDFFGDELESIRRFDPASQRSTGPAEAVIVGPVGELLLNPESVERFRTGYRAAFGAARNDPLYEAVSEGRPYPGMEHWLPLFEPEMATLFDCLPRFSVTLDYQVPEAAEARFENIEDFYDARHTYESAAQSDGWVYRPLEPQRLYLGSEEWRTWLDRLGACQFTPFAAAAAGSGNLDAEAGAGLDFAEVRNDPDAQLYDAVRDRLQAFLTAGKDRQVVVTAFGKGARERLRTMLGEHGLVQGAVLELWSDLASLAKGTVGFASLPIEHGFRVGGTLLVTEQDILGERLTRKAPARRKAANFLTEVSSLSERDYVVHVDHGIGRYEGLMTLEVDRARHDCLLLIYQGGDKLYLPVENIDLLSRFGSEDTAADLDRLGGPGWQARKARVKQRLKDMAAGLIKVAAARALRTTEPMIAPEGLDEEFAARFPYVETDDQLRAIEDTLTDLATDRPMDRLICGDVGFGKTEIALRATFAAALNGHQVAIVVPTTLLCRQHFKTFEARFKGLPVEVRQLSRLVPPKHQALVREGLAAGKVDIVVGTHTLLSKQVRFRDLGLLIVDEEQHFGVKQKEKLKALREEVHVLTMTATPIPRTLQLAMSGVKEMSLIATPPVDRLAVRTFVLPYDPVVVREAIMREYFRGGQIFYVCPRVQDIAEIQERLAKLVPEVKVAAAHGQMPPSSLEDVMTGFYDHRFDLLLSTNIIESGLDIPAANTLILHRADMFGLSQLYQLRGRIGRAKLRAYAYFTLPQGRILTPAAEKRLQVMQTLDGLGAGFQLASHDLDIRGAGNLLGEEQSGHIREVGIELYQQMLEEAVANARGGGALAGEAEAVGKDEGKDDGGAAPLINLGSSVLIPEAYVHDLNIRLGLYRRLASLTEAGELESFAAELIDRFGPLPTEVENLLQVMAIKQLCRRASVAKLDAGPKGVVISFRDNSFGNPAALVGLLQQQAGKLQLRPDHRLVYRQSWDSPDLRLAGVRSFMTTLAKTAAA